MEVTKKVSSREPKREIQEVKSTRFGSESDIY